MKRRQTDPSALGDAGSSVSPSTVVEFGLKPISIEDWLTFRAFVRKLSGDEKLQFLSQLENAAEIIHEEIAMIEIEESIPAGDSRSDSNVFNFQTNTSFEQ
jgi:hypothetical protein